MATDLFMWINKEGKETVSLMPLSDFPAMNIYTHVQFVQNHGYRYMVFL